MKVLSKHQGNWIEAIVQGRWVEAKVFREPSIFGINEGRVSKLVISKTDSRVAFEPFFPQMCYNYDRGEDFNEIEPELLDSIVQELEEYGINM